jgi:hypothetical protein
MKLNTLLQLIIYPVFILAYTQTIAAPPPPHFIQFSPAATMGALYYPDPEIYPSPHIAALNMHRTGNRMAHLSMDEMSRRGFVILGMNPRCQNNEALCAPWEDNMLDIKQGIDYLRSLPGITTVILLGGSGGGPTMSFYQAVAESGVEFCQQPQKLIKCSDKLANLPPADGIVFRDAHLGNGIGVMRSLNPAITNDFEIINQYQGPVIDPSIDPFNPDNGYNPDGESVYTEEFKEKYFIAQAARMNRLIDIALGKMQQIAAGTYKYPDDDVFIVPGGAGARLAQLDASIDQRTNRIQKLLLNDGTIEDCCTVNSVRSVGQARGVSESFDSGTLFLTLKSFLSANAIRAMHSMNHVDFCSSNNSTSCNVQMISVPTLVTAMQGHYFVRTGEIIYDAVASADKDFIIIEGATHGGTPCRECMPSDQAYDGRYDNAVKNTYDYVAHWINARF